MGRFLIFFSYIGTHYRGLQIQRRGGEVVPDIKTVQGALERCLQRLGPANEVIVKTSSRTDSDVHAVCNTVHVDLLHKYPPKEFDPHWLSSKLNWCLIRNREKIRVTNVLRVTDNFSSRHQAVDRSYMFRLAVVKDMSVFSERNLKGFPMSATDCDSSVRVFPPFDVNLFCKAAEILSGHHNFLSFTTTAFHRLDGEVKLSKTMSIRIRRSTPFLGDAEHTSQLLDFWEVHFSCRSFLYKQVRRMVGAMVSVAQGGMTLDTLQDLLDNPSLTNPGKIKALQGHGLYLTNIHYPDEVLAYEPTESSTCIQSENESDGDEDDELDDDDIAQEKSKVLSSTPRFCNKLSKLGAERIACEQSSACEASIVHASANTVTVSVLEHGAAQCRPFEPETNDDVCKQSEASVRDELSLAQENTNVKFPNIGAERIPTFEHTANVNDAHMDFSRSSIASHEESPLKSTANKNKQSSAPVNAFANATNSDSSAKLASKHSECLEGNHFSTVDSKTSVPLNIPKKQLADIDEHSSKDIENVSDGDQERILSSSGGKLARRSCTVM